MRAGLDRFAERSGTSELLAQAGLGTSLAALVGTAVRLTIVVIATFAALTLLGLAFLSDSLNEGIVYIPRLLAALALVLVGVVLGAFVRAWIDRSSAQLDFPVAIGPVVQVLIIVLFGVCAAAQAGVSVAPLTAIAIVLLGAIAVTLALAFGLGAREVARSLTSGRYARADFEVGQTIRVGDAARRDRAHRRSRDHAQVRRDTIRIPNSMLVERIVIVEGAERGRRVTPERAPPSGSVWTHSSRPTTEQLFARAAREREPGEPRRGGPALSAAGTQPRPPLPTLRRAHRGSRAGRLHRPAAARSTASILLGAPPSRASPCRRSWASSDATSAIAPGPSASHASCRS